MAVVAGSGRLPVDLAESLAAHGHTPFVVMVAGRGKSELASFDHEELALGEFRRPRPLLKRQGVTHAVFAGGIARRPRLTALKPSLALLRLLPRVLVGARQGRRRRAARPGRRSRRTASRWSGRMRSRPTCWLPKGR